ncbi:uncharacterized protein LOC118366167 [Oncorhynchus keta]|uniref:uncharacterized protein LOC118366167 n=1 Tax=Oncorhynchus keta TaxID=8018 RepID=UPI0015FBD9A2|nr:uncharacterized protein LOC118366167 [Oncorhynchus keta]XP_052347769.1 uncharacterized protein LOC118366167 [Oncorhynchus keta]XP_052347770.1 uncharacterized protein LOC118366167 [Oncorhynchus keta]XP_052347771.1 uncharacterized protein LOC118366167 [Oncorhynchus keta]XP_052347772.1 uncharacterized protein LOC118366167 [Oncorhynchus keta]XP_052347773.1 uncharacterized protein LOC118366167 [Oncorhynchus keta]
MSIQLKQQAGSHLRAPKERHVRDLSLKKDKLQHLLLKLDTMKGPPGQDPRWQYSRGSLDRMTGLMQFLGTDREAAGERTANNHMEDGESMTPEDGDTCDHSLHSCWRGIFQSISFSFSLTTSFIIELLSFITQYVIKVFPVLPVLTLSLPESALDYEPLPAPDLPFAYPFVIINILRIKLSHVTHSTFNMVFSIDIFDTL